jgi:hypothetical protein
MAAEWDELKYSTFTFSVDPSGGVDHSEMVLKQTKTIMILAGISVAFWFISGAGLFLTIA